MGDPVRRRRDPAQCVKHSQRRVGERVCNADLWRGRRRGGGLLQQHLRRDQLHALGCWQCNSVPTKDDRLQRRRDDPRGRQRRGRLSADREPWRQRGRRDRLDGDPNKPDRTQQRQQATGDPDRRSRGSLGCYGRGGQPRADPALLQQQRRRPMGAGWTDNARHGGGGARRGRRAHRPHLGGPKRWHDGRELGATGTHQRRRVQHGRAHPGCLPWRLEPHVLRRSLQRVCGGFLRLPLPPLC